MSHGLKRRNWVRNRESVRIHHLQNQIHCSQVLEDQEWDTYLEVPFTGLVAEYEHASIHAGCACGGSHEENQPFGNTVSLSISSPS